MRQPRYRHRFYELGRLVHRIPTDLTLEEQRTELLALFKHFGLNAKRSTSHEREGQRSNR